MTTKSVFALALEAGIKTFDQPDALTSKSIDQIAEQLLAPRNPYFNAAYRERYNIRVHALEVSTQRLALGCVESAAPKDNEDARRYRAVIFRCDGNVIYQTPDNRVLDNNGALVDLRYHMQHVDEREVLAALCLQQIKMSAKMRDGAERTLSILNKQGP